MKITSEHHGLIDQAETADGSIQYWPIASRLLIDGRDVYQGHFCDPITGRITVERPAPDKLRAALDLKREVDASRSAWDEAARERASAVQGARNPGISADSSFWGEEEAEIVLNGSRRN